MLTLALQKALKWQVGSCFGQNLTSQGPGGHFGTLVITKFCLFEKGKVYAFSFPTINSTRYCPCRSYRATHVPLFVKFHLIPLLNGIATILKFQFSLNFNFFRKDKYSTCPYRPPIYCGKHSDRVLVIRTYPPSLSASS